MLPHVERAVRHDPVHRPRRLGGAVRRTAATRRPTPLRREHFAALRAAVAEHGGREVKSTGDGLMVAFPSAVAAVRCAVDMQRATAGADAARLQDRPRRGRAAARRRRPLRHAGDRRQPALRHRRRGRDPGLRGGVPGRGPARRRADPARGGAAAARASASAWRPPRCAGGTTRTRLARRSPRRRRGDHAWWSPTTSGCCAPASA